MDDNTQLRCRNAALETELRLVKEQLAQAHGATNYLVSTISRQQAQYDRSTIHPLQARLDETLAENARLRAHALARHQSVGTAGYHSTSHKQAPTLQLQSQLPPSPALTSEQNARSDVYALEISASDDLLSFQDGEGSTSPGAWVSPSPVCGKPGTVVSPDSSTLLDTPTSPTFGERAPVGLDTTSVNHKQQSVVIPPSQHVVTSKANAEASHIIKHADGSTSFVMLTPESPSPVPSTSGKSSSPTRASTGSRWHFAHFERLQLLGQACWIEDLDDDKYAAKWQDIASKKGRHTAAEWQEFYEGVIRPAYYKKQAAKAEEIAAAEAEDSDTEEDVENEDAKHSERVLDDNVDMLLGHMDTVPLIETHVGKREAEAVVDGDDAEKLTEQDDATSTPADTAATSECGKTVRAAPLTEPELQGLAASRWAPRAVCVETSGSPEATNFASLESHDNALHLPTVEEFCGEQELSARRLAEETEEDSQKNAASLLITLHSEPQSRVALTENRGRRLAPVPRPTDGDGRLGRGGYVDKRPRCCHWPWDEQQLLHNSFQHDASTLRSVMIRNIPPNITLAEVLDEVRGCKVIFATYLPLSEMRTKPVMETNAVIVTFVYANEARAYTDFCGKNFIFFWSERWNAPFRATTTHIQTPVRPPPSLPSIQQIRNDGLSRAVFLLDNGVKTPESAVNAVLGLLAQRCGRLYEYCNYPVRMGRDEYGVLFFEFASIEDAVVFKRAMESLHWEFGDMSNGFLPDPCRRALEGLKEIPEAFKMNGCSANTMSVLSEGEESPYSELGEGEYTTAKGEAGTRAEYSGEEAEATGTPVATATDCPTGKSTPRTGWNMGGDLEAAKAFLGAVEKNYARGQTPAPRGTTVVSPVDAEEDEVMRETEAIGAEG